MPDPKKTAYASIMRGECPACKSTAGFNTIDLVSYETSVCVSCKASYHVYHLVQTTERAS